MNRRFVLPLVAVLFTTFGMSAEFDAATTTNHVGREL
jgi:hypothetical protein